MCNVLTCMVSHNLKLHKTKCPHVKNPSKYSTFLRHTNFFKNTIIFFFRIMNAMTDIYYGRVQHPWAMNIENWEIHSAEAEKVNEYKNSLLKHFQHS